MNKLLKELELQAYIEHESEWIDPSSNMPVMVKGLEFSREKFAELIVRECAARCYHLGRDSGPVTAGLINVRILSMVGVKE